MHIIMEIDHPIKLSVKMYSEHFISRTTRKMFTSPRSKSNHLSLQLRPPMTLENTVLRGDTWMYCGVILGSIVVILGSIVE